MMLGNFLDRHADDKLYVMNVDHDYLHPVEWRLWWTVLSKSGWVPCLNYKATEGGEYCASCSYPASSAVHNNGDEALRLTGRDGRYGGLLANGNRYSVTIDPHAPAVYMAATPVPCPKVRASIGTEGAGKNTSRRKGG